MGRDKVPRDNALGEEELYGLVSDLMDRNEFDSKVAEVIEEFGGLLNRDAAAHVLADRLERYEVKYHRIAKLKDGAEARLRVKVKEIGEIKEFKRKNGGSGRVANILISDGSGSCRLVLWDKDVNLVESGKIEKNSILKIISGYVKISKWGTEVSLGKWGILDIDE